MSNPLLKAAGLQGGVKGFAAERALFDAAWELVNAAQVSPCRHYSEQDGCVVCEALAAFDKAAKVFQEEDV